MFEFHLPLLPSFDLIEANGTLKMKMSETFGWNEIFSQTLQKKSSTKISMKICLPWISACLTVSIWLIYDQMIYFYIFGKFDIWITSSDAKKCFIDVVARDQIENSSISYFADEGKITSDECLQAWDNSNFSTDFYVLCYSEVCREARKMWKLSWATTQNRVRSWKIN